MFWLRWVLAVPTCALGAYATIMNWLIVVNVLFRDRRGVSLGPLIGGACLSVGILLIPENPLHWLWWTPLILDPGSAFVCTYTAVWLLFRRVRRAKNKREDSGK